MASVPKFTLTGSKRKQDAGGLLGGALSASLSTLTKPPKIETPKPSQPTPTQINRQDAAQIKEQTRQITPTQINRQDTAKTQPQTQTGTAQKKWNEVTLEKPSVLPSTPITRQSWEQTRRPYAAGSQTELGGGKAQIRRGQEDIAEWERLRQNPDFAEVSKTRTVTSAQRSQDAYDAGSAVADLATVRPDTVMYDTINVKGGTHKDVDERRSMKTTGGKDLADIPDEVVDLYYYIRNKLSSGEAKRYLESVGWAPYYAMEPGDAFVQGATKGVGAQSLLTVFNRIAHGKESAERLQKALDELNVKAQKDHPAFSGAGNVAGTMALAVPLALGGGAVAGAAGLGGAGTAAVSGAVGMGGTTAIQEAGDLASGRKDASRYLGDVVGSGFAGAAGSGVSYGLGKVGSSVLQQMGLTDNALAQGTVGLVRGGGSAATRVGITEGVEYLQDPDGYEFNAQDALNQVLVSGAFDAIMSAVTKPAAPKTAMVANGQGADMSAEEDLLLRQTFGENYQKMSADEIAKAYRTLARANHPDLVGSAGEEAMKRLNTARDIYQRLFSGKAHTAYQTAQTARVSGDTAAYRQAATDFANSVNGLQTIIETDTSATPKVAEAMQILNAVSVSMGRDAVDHTGQMYDNESTAQKTVSTGETESTVIDTDPATHTPEQMTVIEKYKAAVDKGIAAFVEHWRGLKDPNYRKRVKMDIAPMDQRTAQDVKAITGVDVSDFKGHTLSGSALAHIERRHGTKGEADHSMADLNDIARMGYVLEHYDSVELLTDENGKTVFSKEHHNADGSHAPMVRFLKRVDGTYYVVEAVPDAAAKELRVVSAYMDKASGSTDQVLNMTQNRAPQLTSKTPDGAYASTLKWSIPQTTPAVKAPTKTPAQLAHEAKVLSGLPLVDHLGSFGRSGLTHLLESHGAVGDAEASWNVIDGYMDLYLAGFDRRPVSQDILPADATPAARRLTASERLLSYYNGLNDAGVTSSDHTPATAMEQQLPENEGRDSVPNQQTDSGHEEKAALTEPETGSTIGESKGKRITVITEEAIGRVPVVQLPGYTAEECETIRQQHQELLRYAREENQGKEVAFVLRPGMTDRAIFTGSDDALDFGSSLSGTDLIVMHNHPRNSSFSHMDITFMLRHDGVKCLTIIKNNGGVEILIKTDAYDKKKAATEMHRCYSKRVTMGTDQQITKAVQEFLKKGLGGFQWITIDGC